MSVIKQVKEITTEKVEKRGKVMGATETFERADRIALRETKDLEKTDMNDQEVEQTMDRDRKQNNSV